MASKISKYGSIITDIKKAKYTPSNSYNHKYKDLTPGRIYDVIEVLKWADGVVSRIKLYNDNNECCSYYIETNNGVIFKEAIIESRNKTISDILN